MVKIAIVSPNGSISKSNFSHRSAFVKFFMHKYEKSRPDFNIEWKIQPPANELESCDIVFIYLGMEYNGKGLNVFGGDASPVLQYFKKIDDILKPLVTLDKQIAFIITREDLPLELYVESILMAEKRLGIELRNLKNYINWMSDTCLAPLYFHLARAPVPHNERYNEFVVGDSHALGLYGANTVEILRHDGKTLHGSLSAGFDVKNMLSKDFQTKIIFNFGNIDIRHHLYRQLNPIEATKRLAIGYAEKLAALKDKNIKLFMTELLPIEDESRVLPKTGWYKGVPFYGSAQMRREIRRLFNETVHNEAKRHKLGVLQYPTYFESEPGVLDQKYMEKPRSVHIAWEYSRLLRPNDYTEIDYGA